jgi:polyhydroxyalkanoate synthesis regulator phasin
MNFFEKAFYMGLGAVSFTREKAEKMFDEMVEKGELSRDEAKKKVEDFIKKGEEQKKEFRSMIREELNDWRKDFGMVTRAELEGLEARIRELESKLNQAQ